jgi:hypothetical protein
MIVSAAKEPVRKAMYFSGKVRKPLMPMTTRLKNETVIVGFDFP